ncbi:hypothetical protein BCR42DRAFT_398740 [Absidia repens]|uniref:Secreted protein n=1 Tax=Absidia repens TaxID=90262 RepID=A0A1X2HYC6_9FUNG|nr:hypothetical protein BCR42DRAFT_398740 [Absidia repens]
MNIKILGVLIAFMVLAIHHVESARLSITFNTQSLPMMVSNICGLYDGKKKLLDVTLVGNWAQMDLDKEKCNESKDLGYKLCMVGSVCRVHKLSGGKVDTIECTPKGGSTPDPTGHGFVTTNSCYKQRNVDYV